MADAKKTMVGQVRLKNVRLSFENIYEPGKPQANDAGEMVPGKYGSSFLMEKGTDETKANMAKLKKARQEVSVAKWGDNIPKLKPDRVCTRDGDLEDWDGYANHFYVSTKNKNQPVVVGRDRRPVVRGAAGAPYSGCFVNAIVRLWAQDDPKYGKRINASLEAVQYVKKGDAFGAAPVDPNEAFDEIEDDEDDDLGPIDEGDDDLDDAL